jgi:hypothetical protein
MGHRELGPAEGTEISLNKGLLVALGTFPGRKFVMAIGTFHGTLSSN